MSYRCGKCDVVQAAGIRPNVQVTSVRKKEYRSHLGDSWGWETIQEAHLCDGCHNPDADASSAMREEMKAHLASERVARAARKKQRIEEMY